MDRRRAEGLACIAGTAVAWIASSFISQALVRPGGGGAPPRLPPFLLCYVCTSQFAVYIPIVAAARALRTRRRKACIRQVHRQSLRLGRKLPTFNKKTTPVGHPAASVAFIFLFELHPLAQPSQRSHLQVPHMQACHLLQRRDSSGRVHDGGTTGAELPDGSTGEVSGNGGGGDGGDGGDAAAPLLGGAQPGGPLLLSRGALVKAALMVGLLEEHDSMLC
jgi:hypothetical protein